MPALRRMNVTVRDLSPTFKTGDDYPKIGKAVAAAVARSAERHGSVRGVLFCGSGVGMVIAANRVKNARAVEAMSAAQVRLARQHNDANILAIGGWSMSPTEALRLIKTFLATRASTATRHRRRVKQLG